LNSQTRCRTATFATFGSAATLAGFRRRETSCGTDRSTAVVEAISFVFAVQSTLAGTMNAMGWVAALIYLFGGAGSSAFEIARASHCGISSPIDENIAASCRDNVDHRMEIQSTFTLDQDVERNSPIMER
jgi:hypothetical protein